MESEFLFLFLKLSLPAATVVVAHSPTPSAVKTIASLKGDGKKALAAYLNMIRKNILIRFIIYIVFF